MAEGITQVGSSPFIPFRAPTPAGDGRGAEGIGQFIKWLSEGKDAEEFSRMLAGIKAGLVDPDEALTQGRGAQLYQKFFGVMPPAAPRDVEWQMPDTRKTIVDPAAAVSMAEEDTTPPTVDYTVPGAIQRERVGGFQPRTADQLKSYLIKQMLSGQKPRAELMAAAGIKYNDPEAAMKLKLLLQQNKQAPELAYKYRLNFPDASEQDIFNHVQATLGIGDTTKSPTAGPVPLGPSAATKKITAIGDFKNKELSAKVKHWGELSAEKKDALSSRERMFGVKTRGEILTKIVNEVGPDNLPFAATITDAIMQGNDLEDIAIPPELRKRIERKLSIKEEALDLQRWIATTSAQQRQTGLEQSAARTDNLATYWENLFKLQAQRITNSQDKMQIDATFKTAATLLKDPARRNEATAFLKDSAEMLGFTVADPEGFEALKNFVIKGWGEGALTPPKSLPQPFNPPKLSTTPAPRPGPLTPQQPGVKTPVQIPGKPKTADDFYNKYPWLRGTPQK